MEIDDEDEHEVEVAEREAAAALPEGWELDLPDGERFRLPGAHVQVYALDAAGPGGDAVLVVAVGKANVYRQLVRRLRGELEVADGWAPPVPALSPPGQLEEYLGPYADGAEVRAALEELTQALPAGWQLYEADRERFRLPGRVVEVFAVSAVGRGGEAALVLAVGEAKAYRQLKRRLQGELRVTDAWAPPTPG